MATAWLAVHVRGRDAGRHRGLAALRAAWRSGPGGSSGGPALGPDVDVAHVLMGVAMAGMLVPRACGCSAGRRLGGHLRRAATVWFGWAGGHASTAAGAALGRLAGAHHVQHALGCSSAMVYMFAAVTDPCRQRAGVQVPGMSGMGGADVRCPHAGAGLRAGPVRVRGLDPTSSRALPAGGRARGLARPDAIGRRGRAPTGPVTPSRRSLAPRHPPPTATVPPARRGADAARLRRARPGGREPGRGPVPDPRPGGGRRAAEIAMGVTMAFTLIIMI